MLNKLVFNFHIIPPTHKSREINSNIKLFQNSSFKLALQKNGELTNNSLITLGRAIGIELTSLYSSIGRTLFAMIDDNIGITFAKNKDICQLVANGSVDAGIVGIDQVYESSLRNNLIIVKELRTMGEWDMVLATPKERKYDSLANINIVATQYPIITKHFFSSKGYTPIIIQTYGGTEIMPLLQYRGKNIDGIVDIRVSGNTLRANGMEAWNPPIITIFPVLITNKKAFLNPTKKKYLEKFT